jgi:hypothetical protein
MWTIECRWAKEGCEWVRQVDLDGRPSVYYSHQEAAQDAATLNDMAGATGWEFRAVVAP